MMRAEHLCGLQPIVKEVNKHAGVAAGLEGQCGNSERGGDSDRQPVILGLSAQQRRRHQER